MPIKNINRPLKEEKIVIRVDPKVKEDFNKYVDKKGTNVSDFIRQYIFDCLNSIEEKQDSIKEMMLKITNPEIDLYNKLDLLEKRVFEIEQKLKNKSAINMK